MPSTVQLRTPPPHPPNVPKCPRMSHLKNYLHPAQRPTLTRQIEPNSLLTTPLPHPPILRRRVTNGTEWGRKRHDNGTPKAIESSPLLRRSYSIGDLIQCQNLTKQEQ